MQFFERVDILWSSKISAMSSPFFLSRRRFIGHLSTHLALAGSALLSPDSHAQARAKAQPLERTKVTLSVDGKSSLSYLPLTIAQQLGYFSAEGLDVQIIDLLDAASATQALITGVADVCSGAFDRTLQLPTKSQLFQAFVLQGRTPQLAFGVSTRSLPSVGSADLRSKKVGVIALDSTSTVMAKLLLEREGLAPQDVSWVAVGSSNGALNALRSGQIDAICNSDPVMTILELKGDIKIVRDARSLRGTSELFGGLVPSACLFAQTEFIQKYPRVCQALTDAIVHSLKWLQTAGPGDIINTVPVGYLLGDRGLYLAAFNKIRESISIDGLVLDSGASAALKAHSLYGSTLLSAKANAGKSYTNEFARRAKIRFQV